MNLDNTVIIIPAYTKFKEFIDFYVNNGYLNNMNYNKDTSVSYNSYIYILNDSKIIYWTNDDSLLLTRSMKLITLDYKVNLDIWI